jgi:hypothetical protein
MKKAILLFSLVLCQMLNAKIYYVTPSGGSDIYAGNISYPWATWQKAVNSALPGDTVYFREGTWYPTSTVFINPSDRKGRNGTSDNPICFFNFPGETPILDCIQFPESSVSTSGLDIYRATYLKFRGLTVKNVLQTTVGQWISGISYVSEGGTISFENMVSTGHGGTGMWISGYDTLYLINCDSYNHCDSYPTNGSFPGGRADGYNITSGGTVADTFKIAYIHGCRAWYCSDDGFDVSSTKQLDISNSWAWANGRLEGDATGFKVSYSNVLTPSKRKIRNCITAYNVNPTNEYGGGIVEVNLTDSHFGPIFEYFNNSSFHDWMGYVSVIGAFDCTTSETSVICRNNVVYAPTNTSGYQAGFKACNYNFPAYVTQDHNTWVQTGEYYNTEPNDSYEVSYDIFANLDTSQLRRSRHLDGTLPDITFMRLEGISDMIDTGIDVGLGYNGDGPDLGAWEYEYQPGTTNLYPTIELTFPSDYSVFSAGLTITIAANVADADGFVDKVEFFCGNEKLGESNAEPWSFAWDNLPIGSYYLFAVATDNQGAKATTAKVHIRIKPGEVVLYPNPNNGVFNFALGEPLQSNSDLIIASLEGKIVYRGTMFGEEILKQFDLSHIASGLYILVVYENDMIETKKFIKK